MRAHFISGMIVALALTGCGPTALPGALSFDASPPDRGNIPAPQNELARAQADFQDRNFGLAEQRYRKLVESEPKNADAWLGLGAVDDELARFDLADKAYAQVAKLSGTTPELLNDRGYSYMMRGDLRRAERLLLQASVMDPNNTFIANNLRLLAEKKAATAPSKM